MQLNQVSQLPRPSPLNSNVGVIAIVRRENRATNALIDRPHTPRHKIVIPAITRPMKNHSILERRPGCISLPVGGKPKLSGPLRVVECCSGMPRSGYEVGRSHRQRIQESAHPFPPMARRLPPGMFLPNSASLSFCEESGRQATACRQSAAS
ncbi:hypothetical protein VTK26DRAFT_8156 [Humicola hyalothermophila]